MDLSGLTSVTTKAEMLAWLSANCETPIQPPMTGSDIGTIMQKMLSLPDGNALVLFDTKTADHTLGLTDNGIAMDIEVSGKLIVPANAVVAFPVGTQVQVMQAGTGQITISAAPGVTINSLDGASNHGLNAQFSGASLIKTGTDTWWLRGDLGASAIETDKIAKINLTNAGNDATSPGWNDFYFSNVGTPMPLVTPTAAATGWSITAAIGTPGTVHFEHIPGATFGNADFPDDVLDSLWYLDGGTNFRFLVTGLSGLSTYTVKTCTADNGTGDGVTRVTVAGASQQTGSPDHTAIELTFTGVTADDNGNIAITVDGIATGAFPLLNGIIMQEVPWP